MFHRSPLLKKRLIKQEHLCLHLPISSLIEPKLTLTHVFKALSNYTCFIRYIFNSIGYCDGTAASV